MCRFYALRATVPTRVDCCLVQAPNSLLAQSRQDLRGFENADGWGIAAFGGPAASAADWVIERHPDPAHEGLRFKAAAARAQATTVLAHVRHATVGTVALENTHPFRHGGWTFVHNGTVPYFAAIQGAMLAAMSAEHRAAIRGSTDSEHLFHLALSAYERAAGEQAPHDRTTPEAAPAGALLTSLQLALRQVVAWCREIGQEPHLGLNVLLSDGVRMVGSRWQRSLHFLERAGPAACPVCGEAHAVGAPAGYRALLIASEPITREAWPEVPERSVFEITADMRLHALPLSTV